MKASTRRRIDALKKRATAAQIGVVPIVDLTKWSDADRRAFEAADGAEQDAMIEWIEGVRPASAGSGVAMVIVTQQPDRGDEPGRAAPVL